MDEEHAAPLKKGDEIEEEATDGPSSPSPQESTQDDIAITWGGRIFAATVALGPPLAVAIGVSAGLANLGYRIVRRLTAWV